MKMEVVLAVRRTDLSVWLFFFFQAEDGIRDYKVTGVQTCALPISRRGLLVGTADPLTTGDVALKTFHRYYPGKSEDIEQALVFDWSREPWVMACEDRKSVV